MKRNLNIEFVRIFSMFLIILGHVLGGFIPLTTEGSTLFRTIVPQFTFFVPFHVNLFVLISGFCGIKRLKNAFKLVVLLLSYLVLIALCAYFFGWGGFDYRSLIQPVSHNPWWFMRVYFLLALISPLLLEPLLKSFSEKESLMVVLAFLFVDVYLGYYCRMETVHYDGYNLIHFITIYLTGAHLRFFNLKKLTYRGLRVSSPLYIGIAFMVVMCFKLVANLILTHLHVKDYFMDYNNPFNILLAVVAFLFFLNLELKNKKILFVSSSVVGVYLLSEHPVIKQKLFSMFNNLIGFAGGNFLLELLLMFSFIFLLFFVSLLIDKIRMTIVSMVGAGLSKIPKMSIRN